MRLHPANLSTLLVACVVAGTSPPDRAAMAQSQSAPPAASTTPLQLSGDPTHYYQRPFDILPFLVSWENAGRPGRDGVMGFLTGVFAKDPARVRTVTDAQVEPRTQPVVIMALMLADKTPQAKDAAQRWGWSPEQMAKITGMPPLLKHKIERPDQFDLLWGASFGTADPVYVRPIYEYFEAAAAAPGIDVADIVTAVTMMRGPKSGSPESKAAMLAMGQKYGRDTFLRVAVAASALWSLESNARQHKFVAAALDALVRERPGTPAVKGLTELKSLRDRR